MSVPFFLLLVNMFVVKSFLFLPIGSIFLGDLPNHPAWNACGDDIVRNVFCYNGTGTDYHVVSNGDAWIDHRVAADPDIVSDMNLFSVFQLLIADDWINRMTGCVNADSWTEEYIVPDMDLGHINNDAVIICIKVFSNVGMAAIIRVKRWLHPEMIADTPKKLPEERQPFISIFFC